MKSQNQSPAYFNKGKISIPPGILGQWGYHYNLLNLPEPFQAVLFYDDSVTAM